MDAIITWALRLILPKTKAPTWVVEFLVILLPSLIEAVQEALSAREMGVIETIETVRDILDDALDVIPRWADIDESVRDSIIEGIANLAMVIVDGAAKGEAPPKPVQLRKASKHIGRRIKREIRRG